MIHQFFSFQSRRGQGAAPAVATPETNPEPKPRDGSGRQGRQLALQAEVRNLFVLHCLFTNCERYPVTELITLNRRLA